MPVTEPCPEVKPMLMKLSTAITKVAEGLVIPDPLMVTSVSSMAVSPAAVMDMIAIWKVAVPADLVAVTV